jgi:hypothetical protein
MITIMDITTNQTLRDHRCADCFRRGYERLLSKHQITDEVIEQAVRDQLEAHIEANSLSSPEMQQQLSRHFSRLTGIADPFAEEKRISNSQADSLYHEWKPKVKQAANPELLALRLAIAGNIMDYGAHQHFDLEQTINKVLHADFAIDHSEKLLKEIKKAEKVLYLCDNAGEIYFDKLFIETLQHPDLTAAVRGFPALNDVTFQDALQAGLHEVCKVIDNGSDAPSTILNDCSREFLQAFQQADLIISKGQGNLEGLLPAADERMYFLLMAKCDVIADLLEVNKGDLIVYNP